MATEAELMTMLKNADSLGEEEDARKIARLIQVKRDAANSAPDPLEEEAEEAPYSMDRIGTDALHIAKGIPQAGVDMLDMPYNLRQAAGAISDAIPNPFESEAAISFVDEYGPEALRGKGLPNISWFTKAIADSEYVPDILQGNAKISDLPGLSQAKAVLASEEEDASRGADALRKGVEWGAGGLRKLVQRGAVIAPDIAMGAGAAIGDYLTDDAKGEIGGGFAGLALSLLKGKKGVTDVANAATAIRETAGDPNILETARAAQDEVGTLADVTRNSKLYDLQSTVDATVDGSRKLDAIELARQQQIASDVINPFGRVDPKPAQEGAQQYIDSVLEDVTGRTAASRTAAAIPYAAKQEGLAKATERVQRAAAEATAESDKAQQALLQAQVPLKSNQTLAESSAVMSDLARAEKAVDDKASQVLWAKFKEGDGVSLGPLQQGVSDVFSQLTKTQKLYFNAKHSKLFKWIKGKSDTKIGAADAADSIRRMKATLKKAYDDGVMPEDKHLEDMINALDLSLEGANSAYKSARESTRNLYKRWDNGSIPNALMGEPEMFAKALSLSDELGAVNSRLLNAANIPGMPEAIVGRLKSLVRRKQGDIDGAFMAEYESVMNVLPPQFKKQAGEFLAASDAAESAATNLKSLDKVATSTSTANATQSGILTKALAKEQDSIATQGQALKNTVGRTNLAKYAENPTDTVTALIKAGDGDSLGALYKEIDSLGPAAKEAFKSQVGKDLLAKLTKAGDAAGERAIAGLEAPITPKALTDFLKLRDTLTKSGLLDEVEADKIVAALKRTNSGKNRSGALRKLAEGNQGIDLASSAVAAGLVNIIPGSSSSLILAGAMKRAVKGWFTKTPYKTEAHKLMEEMILDPKQFIAAADGAKTSKEAVDMVITKLNALSQAVGE